MTLVAAMALAFFLMRVNPKTSVIRFILINEIK